MLASPPHQVSEAIAGHRTGLLDTDAAAYLAKETELDDAVLTSAAGYLSSDPEVMALTSGTTVAWAWCTARSR